MNIVIIIIIIIISSFEVTVTSVSLPPFVSRRGLSNTNQRLPRFALFLSKPQDQHVRVVITTQIV